ncbi:MAG TPA: hypothetical protein VLK82_15655 [Candidatus Tectomicrobia bacterium]|nr:hypothetical protein [Candidatus Tectomicrobia bacterium]
MSETYTLTQDGQAMLCRICGRESPNPRHITSRSCGFCHRDHDAPLPAWCDCPHCGQERGRPQADGDDGHCTRCWTPLIAFGGTWWQRPEPPAAGEGEG